MSIEKYHQSLIHHAIPSGKNVMGNNSSCQHENDPKLTGNIVKPHLASITYNGRLSVMDWPPRDSRPQNER